MTKHIVSLAAAAAFTLATIGGAYAGKPASPGTSQQDKVDSGEWSTATSGNQGNGRGNGNGGGTKSEPTDD